ncbi:MAG: YeeE/YedE thiosulfate transporter family protein, partial [Candidatus Flexifilum sp.]
MTGTSLSGGRPIGAASPHRLIRGDGVRFGIAAAIGLGLVAAAFWLHDAPGRGPAHSLSLLIGAALGVVFERGRFCFFCILRDFIEHKNSAGLFALLTALAVGGVGYALVFGVFLPNAFAGRLPPNAHIGPVSPATALAGLAFGLGMALSGACISGHLYRLG